jgi:hypothetical protein
MVGEIRSFLVGQPDDLHGIRSHVQRGFLTGAARVDLDERDGSAASLPWIRVQ